MSHSVHAVITFLDGPVDPGYGQQPGYGGGHPSQGLPISPVHPGNALPPPGSIATLPVFPFDPTRPDAGLPPGPDNSLPSIKPGMKFVAKWLACSGLILVPDNSLPGQSGSIDNSLPQTPEPK